MEKYNVYFDLYTNIYIDVYTDIYIDLECPNFREHIVPSALWI